MRISSNFKSWFSTIKEIEEAIHALGILTERNLWDYPKLDDSLFKQTAFKFSSFEDQYKELMISFKLINIENFLGIIIKSLDVIQKDYENDDNMCAIFIFKQLNLLLSFNNRLLFQRTINYKIQ